MRKGITVEHQRQITACVRKILKIQLVAAIAVAILVSIAWAIPPASVTEPLGVVMVQQSQGVGGASGILASSQVVITSANVVGSQREAFVSFPNGTGVTAEVLFSDIKDDVALLSLPSAASVAPLPLSDSDSLSVGEEVIVSGYPGGNYSETPTRLTGNSSAILMTDLDGHPGNSGGALLRSDHTVVGLIGSTAAFGSARASQTHWAIPINAVKKICREKGYALD